MKNKSIYIEFLNSIVPFTSQEADLIKKSIEVRTYSRGEFLLRESEHSMHTIYIMKGLLREFYYLPEKAFPGIYGQNDSEQPEDDYTYTSWIMGEGNFVYNVRSFLEGTPSKCYIKAEEDSTVIVTNKMDLEYLLDVIPGLNKLVRILQEKGLIEYERRLELLREKDALVRYQKFIKVYPDLQHRVSLKKMATYLNISPRHLSRIRSLPMRK